MCRVDLNHTTQPCSHRWYHLLSSCTATSTLSTCPGRLAIAGWEIKCDFCPFCAGWDVSSDDFIILGGSSSSSSSGGSLSSPSSGYWKTGRHGSVSSAASVSSADAADDTKWRAGGLPLGVPLSRQPSLAASVSGARKASRSDSFAGSDIAPYELAGPVLGALEKNQQMNKRIHGYIDELPELGGGAKGSAKRSKSKFRKSRTVEREEAADEDDEDSESSAWRRRSKSIVDLVRRR